MKKLIKKIHDNARNKGFWDADILIETSNKIHPQLKIQIKDALISQKLSLVHSELGEATEAMRKMNYGLLKKDTFEDEIADTIIRLFDICGGLNIDIEKQIKWKMKYNSHRPAKHGKTF